VSDSFLKKYIQLIEGTEIPGIFALWCGLYSISMCLGRGVWIDMGTYIIYPNLYVVLVASSGRCRKSTAIGIPERLAEQMEPMKPNIISQSITMQAIFDGLKVVDTTDVQQFMKEKCVGYVIADELSTFLNKTSYQMGIAPLLIQLYDCKRNVRNQTKARGTEELTDTCMGILGGTTIDWIRDAIPPNAVGGGLTSRICFVYSADPGNPVSITRRTEKLRKTEEEVLKMLQYFTTIQGEAIMSPAAEAFMEKEYIKFYKGTTWFHNRYLSGYASRRQAHMQKLALLYSVASQKENPLIIDECDMISGLRTLEMTEKQLPTLMNIITSSDYGALMEEVSSVIASQGEVDKMFIMNKMVHKMDQAMLGSTLSTLISAGRLKVRNLNGTVVYSSANHS
jgi:hypothetical protein